MIKLLHICPTFENPTCGIGRYSQQLYAEIKKDPEFGQAVLSDGLLSFHSLILENKPDIVHFQFEYGFASPQRLRMISDYCCDNGIKFGATFHSLSYTPHHDCRFDFVIVHTPPKGLVGRFDNAYTCRSFRSPIPNLVPGIPPRMPFLQKNPYMVFGQAHPHKTFLPIFHWAERNQMPLLAVVSKPVAGDSAYYDKLKAFAENSEHILFVDDYWSDEKILAASTLCRGAIFFYQEYGTIGVSAAVKLLLANPNLPIVCNEVSHFSDIHASPLTHRITWIGENDEIPRQPKPPCVVNQDEFTFSYLANRHRVLYHDTLTDR